MDYESEIREAGKTSILVTLCICILGVPLAMAAWYFLAIYLPFGWSQILLFVLAFLALSVYFTVVRCFIIIIKGKGYFETKVGWLWLIGLFMTPIVLGLIAVALPAKAGSAAWTDADATAANAYEHYNFPEF